MKETKKGRKEGRKKGRNRRKEETGENEGRKRKNTPNIVMGGGNKKGGKEGR